MIEKRLADIFKTLGHPERVLIMHYLCNSPQQEGRVKSIYEALDIPQPSVSRHLGLMARLSIVERKTISGSVIYCIGKKEKAAKCLIKCFCGMDITSKPTKHIRNKKAQT